jgi:predicted Zn finger-like uncharacterized protein
MVPRNRVIRRIMLVVCPSCSASYRLNAAALGPDGRTVRCAACRATWFVAAAAEDEPAPAEAAGAETAGALAETVAEPTGPPPEPVKAVTSEVVPAAVETAPRPARPNLHVIDSAEAEAAEQPGLRARRRPPRLSAPASMRVQLRPAMLVVVMGALVFGGGLMWRRSVVGLFPQAAPLYQAVGLPVNLRGLAFRDVQSSETIENGTAVLHISGRIENVSGAAADVPRLRLSVRGSGGREIYVWTVMPGKPRLGAGESLPFRAELASPPAAGREVAVRFLTARDLTASLNDKASE